MSKEGFLLELSVTATITFEKIRDALVIMSRCPFVGGSKLPGYTAIGCFIAYFILNYALFVNLFLKETSCLCRPAQALFSALNFPAGQARCHYEESPWRVFSRIQ